MDDALLAKRQLSFFYFINRAEEPKVRIYKESCWDCFLCQMVRYCCFRF